MTGLSKARDAERVGKRFWEREEGEVKGMLACDGMNRGRETGKTRRGEWGKEKGPDT